MKFQLFGRLRDDDGESGSSGSTSGDPSPAFGSQNNSPAGLSGGSLDRTVENMFSQGYSEEEIKQELQGQYSREEIQKAVSNAVASSATGQNGGGPEPMTPYKGSEDAVSPMDEGYDNQQPQGQNSLEPDTGSMAPQRGEPQQMDMQPQQGGRQPTPSSANQQTEELIETIVAENLQKVEREFENVYQEIDEMKEQLEDLENRVHDLEVRDDEDQQQFIEKVDEMEEHIDDYQSRIGGLEKAFQQVLPSLVDNIRDLTSLVQEIKQEKGIETSRSVSQDDISDIDMKDWN